MPIISKVQNGGGNGNGNGGIPRPPSAAPPPPRSADRRAPAAVLTPAAAPIATGQPGNLNGASAQLTGGVVSSGTGMAAPTAPPANLTPVLLLGAAAVAAWYFFAE